MLQCHLAERRYADCRLAERCNADCHLAERHYTDRRFAERRYADCRLAERCNANCHLAERHYTDRRFADCRLAERVLAPTAMLDSKKHSSFFVKRVSDDDKKVFMTFSILETKREDQKNQNQEEK